MRRTLLTVITIFILALPAFAAVRVDESAGRGFSVYAQMGEYLNVSLDMIPNNGYEGTPFDLMGNDVFARESNPPAGYGRKIATWSLMTNAGNRTLTISAAPLTQVSTASGEPLGENPQQINYRLAFALSGYSQAQKTMVRSDILVYSGNTFTVSQGSYGADNIIDNWVISANGEVNMPYISQDQDVRVVLMKAENTPYTQEERDLWPSGMYRATITITITGGDSN